MPEETKTTEVPVTEAPSQESAPESTPSNDTASPAETPSWQDILNTVDPKELRKHPRYAGILGTDLQRVREEERKRVQQEISQKAAQSAQEELLKLANEDPVAFSEKYLAEEERKKINDTLSNVHTSARYELAERIGRSYQDLPEWKDLTEADYEFLTSALIGKPEDEVVPIFNSIALDLIARKRAENIHNSWKSKDEPKLREAIRQEEAAKLLKTSEAPDTTPPKSSPGKIDIRGMSDDEFNRFWNTPI